MNTLKLKLTLAALALTIGSVAAQADAKAPPLNPARSAATLKVDMTRTIEIGSVSGKSRPTIFGHDAADTRPLFGHYASSYGN